MGEGLKKWLGPYISRICAHILTYIVENNGKNKRVLPVQMQKVEMSKIIENPNKRNVEKEKAIEKYEKEKQHKRKIKKEGLDPNEIEKQKKLVRLKKQLE